VGQLSVPTNGHVHLDLRGLKCPLPVLKSRKRLSALPPGTVLELLTTDPLAVIDIAHMCREDGNILELAENHEAGHRFLIRKS
jgi:tRNA 2-thiouridine synthesizing protein A